MYTSLIIIKEASLYDLEFCKKINIRINLIPNTRKFWYKYQRVSM